MPSAGSWRLYARNFVLIVVLPVAAAFLVAVGLTTWDLLSRADSAQQPAVDSDITVYRGARIHTANGPVIEKGVLVVAKGKILDVGDEAAVKVPVGAKVRDLGGRTLIPGLVDTHSHIGIFNRPSGPHGSDGNEMTGPVQPGLRALDAIDPNDPGIRMALAGGVTVANIMPGSGNAIGGQTLYVKLKGATIEAMRLVIRNFLGGIKFANGENPKGAYGSKNAAPGTRMKVAALQREMLAKAKHYKQQWDNYDKAKKEGKEVSPPERDINLEPLREVLDRKRTVHFHCHRADDIMTAVRLSREFDFEIVLQHCTEGYLVAEELAKMGIWVSLTLIDSPGGKPEVMGLIEENAAILTKKGVKVAINTDDSVTESRFFLRTGAIAVRGGLSEADALKALTINSAQMLHLDDVKGSLEKGKDADFVVLSGAPFSVYTQVLETYIEGDKVFDRSQHEDWTHQAGGFALGKSQQRLPKRAELLQGAPVVSAPKDFADHVNPKEKASRVIVLAGRLHTMGPLGTVENAAVEIVDGKVVSVGTIKGFPKAKLDGAQVIRVPVATPGLIDTHAVVGLSGALNFKKADQDQDEMSDPNQADLRVRESFNPHEPLLQFVREQGVTVVHAMPGRANVIAGQTGIYRTQGRTVDQMEIRFPAGILVNLGEIPKSSYPGKLPGTRMGTANLVRTAFAQAQAHAKKKDAAPNLKAEALNLAMKADPIPVIFSAHRADDLMTALRIADEFKLKPMLSLATEAYLITDQLKASKAPVLVHPTMQRPSSPETFHGSVGNAAHLADNGVPISICTSFEGYVPKTRVLRFEAAMAMVNGLGYDRALRSVTLDAAKILGIEKDYGSLEIGKVGDIVLYDGDPFEHSTHVTHTIMNGRVVYDRAEYLKMPFERRALALSSSSSSGPDNGCCLSGW
jgi:imidazolonepropionase-like amidohydrolase